MPLHWWSLPRPGACRGESGVGAEQGFIVGAWGATDFSEIPRTFTNGTKAFIKYVRCMSMSEPLIWKASVDAYEVGKVLVVIPKYTIIVIRIGNTIRVMLYDTASLTYIT